MAIESTELATAVLELFDGSIKFNFLIQPETIRYSPRAVFSSLPVLNTAQPLVKYQHSENSILIPDAKLWTDTGLISIKPQLDQLVAWTMPDPKQLIPKLLKFSWGTESIPRCYLQSFPYSVTARMANTEPTMATGDLELLLAPEPPAPNKTSTTRQLTPRELQENQDKLDRRIAQTPGLRQQLGLRSNESPVVRQDGKVIVRRDGQSVVLGSLATVLGDQTPPTLR